MRFVVGSVKAALFLKDATNDRNLSRSYTRIPETPSQVHPMISFTIQRVTAERLSRFGLACGDDKTMLDHICIRVGTDKIRFCATNGRLLASLVVHCDQIQGSGDIILDRDQFTTAMKSASKIVGSVNFMIDVIEARVICRTMSTVIRRIDGKYPNVDHVWSRLTDKKWMPSLCSLDYFLVGLAQKISGVKTPLLFSSPVDETGNKPAYWCDHELAFLIMPITRSDSERQLDFSLHAVSLPQASTLVA